MQAQNQFFSEQEVQRYVAACEADFEARLEAASAAVCAVPGLKLIALSGPTCSGKTTTANKLIENLSHRGKTVHIVSIDDFYYDRDVLTARAEKAGTPIDYDSIDTIDFDALRECVREIFTTEQTLVPRYDFQTGRRSGFTAIAYDVNDLFIFEGIQAVYPAVSALFAEYCSRSVYICVEEPIAVAGETFAPNEIRFLRRLVRDNNFRAASPAFTFSLWESVRQNEEKNIFPFASACDVRINSAMAYEINMLKPHLVPLLEQIAPADDAYPEARALLARLADVTPISDRYLGENSLYHEFLR